MLAVPAGAARPLEAPVVEKGISLLALENPAGLGAEAARLETWADGRRGLGLEAGTVADDAGRSFALSTPLAQALSRMNAYFAMTTVTAARPIRHEELAAVLLSTTGTDMVGALYERMIAERISFHGRVIIPEIGGDATIDGTLTLHELADPGRPLFAVIAKNGDSPADLSAAVAGHEDLLAFVDETGLLSRALKSWPGWVTRDKPPKAEREAIFRQAVSTVMENSARAFLYAPRAQLAAMVGQDWSGRYAGMWHAHPPHFRPGGWEASDEPSDFDRKIAREEGQNLTLVFQPDGFDAYDLAAGAKVSYRGEPWKRRFAAIHAQVH